MIKKVVVDNIKHGSKGLPHEAFTFQMYALKIIPIMIIIMRF